MFKKLIGPIVIILSALYAGVLVLSNSNLPVRPIFMAWFILFCPGMALIGLFNVEDALSQWVLTLALSLVLSTVLAGLSLIAHFWSPTAEFAILIAISFIGAILQIKNALKFQPTRKETV